MAVIPLLLFLILPQRNEHTDLKRYMHPHVYCSIIYNSQDMATTQCPSTDVPISLSLSLSHTHTHTHTHTHRGMLPSHKKGGDLAICNNVDVPRGYYAK